MAVSSKEMAVFLKILGMLGSDFDGERAAAGLKASEFLKSRNLQWSDVIGVAVAPQQERQEREPPRERYRRYRYDPDQEPFDDDEPEQPKQKSKHQLVCLTLLSKYRRFLSAEDIEFVEKVMRLPFLLNAYRERLKGIIAKVKAKR